MTPLTPRNVGSTRGRPRTFLCRDEELRLWPQLVSGSQECLINTPGGQTQSQVPRPMGSACVWGRGGNENSELSFLAYVHIFYSEVEYMYIS